MLKKILIVLAVLIVVLAFAASFFARKAPDLLIQAVRNALSRDVEIGSVDYQFPSHFEMKGFHIREKAPFSGETSFYADTIELDVSPISLFQKKLTILKIQVANATIVVRKRGGRLMHPLSDAVKSTRVPEGASDRGQGTSSDVSKKTAILPLEINKFNIKNSHFKFLDYDALQEGFVITLDGINAEIRHIELPFSHDKMSYQAAAQVLQGRDQRPAEFQLSGWTRPASFETEAHFTLKNIFLPYFNAYYLQVTPATIESGFLDARMNLNVENKELSTNADLEISGLLFQSYENDNQLFGLKADEILSFLKDSSNKLKFQITARWNVADRSVRARDVIRKSIEHSLKNTILGNVGNILQNVIQRIGEKGVDQSKEDLEFTVKKIKELFRN